LAIQEFLSFYL